MVGQAQAPITVNDEYNEYAKAGNVEHIIYPIQRILAREGEAPAALPLEGAT